jgi:uncharacterized RDD family membrane protein YckC
MADVSQGPGWWIASDGKWYPPHLHPSVVLAPPPPGSYGSADPQPASTQPAWDQSQKRGVAWSSAASFPNYPPGYGPPQPYGPPPGMGAMGLTYSQDPSVRIDGVLHVALAPWWKRFLAILIDGIILGGALFLLVAIIGAATRNTNTSTTQSSTLNPGQAFIGFFTLFILLSIPFMLYYGIMNGSKRGQTVGKMALSIAVRDARTGGPIGFWRGVGRYAITIVFYVVLFIPYIIDNLSPLWDSRRQAWHDKLVHSVVVELTP